MSISMDYEAGKRQMLPLARTDALTIREVTILLITPDLSAPSPGGEHVIWLWLDADARPDLTQFWSLHSRSGGGAISQVWWFIDIDEAPSIPPCLYLLCRLVFPDIAEITFFLRFPLPDLLWALHDIEKASYIGLSIREVPAALSDLEGGGRPVSVDMTQFAQLLHSSVIINELSKHDLQNYVQRWRDTVGQRDSEQSSVGPIRP